MSKIGCEVIRDLLPSYIDEICSEETVKLVEEHFKGCQECRALAERMKKEELSVEMNIDAINYMKKLKRHMLNKNLFSFGILFCVMVVGMTAVLYRNGSVNVGFYYVSGPILIISAYLMLQDYTMENTAARWKVIMALISGLCIVYMGIVENSIIHMIQTGILPQGIQTAKLGTFTYYQLIAIALVHAVIFVAAIAMNLRTGNSCQIVLVISSTGGCAALAFVALLTRLDSPQVFLEVRNRELSVILVEGMIFLLVFGLMGVWKKKAV